MPWVGISSVNPKIFKTPIYRDDSTCCYDGRRLQTSLLFRQGRCGAFVGVTTSIVGLWVITQWFQVFPGQRRRCCVDGENSIAQWHPLNTLKLPENPRRPNDWKKSISSDRVKFSIHTIENFNRMDWKFQCRKKFQSRLKISILTLIIPDKEGPCCVARLNFQSRLKTTIWDWSLENFKPGAKYWIFSFLGPSGIPWKHPENTLKTPWSSWLSVPFSLCTLWVCPLHLSTKRWASQRPLKGLVFPHAPQRKFQPSGSYPQTTDKLHKVHATDISFGMAKGNKEEQPKNALRLCARYYFTESFGWTSQVKRFRQAIETLEKQTFGRGHPWPERGDVHNRGGRGGAKNFGPDRTSGRFFVSDHCEKIGARPRQMGRLRPILTKSPQFYSISCKTKTQRFLWVFQFSEGVQFFIISFCKILQTCFALKMTHLERASAKIVGVCDVMDSAGENFLDKRTKPNILGDVSWHFLEFPYP